MAEPSSPTPAEPAAIGPEREAVIEEARLTCEMFPPARLAKDYGWTADDPASVAERLAATYPAAVEHQIEVACLREFNRR